MGKENDSVKNTEPEMPSEKMKIPEDVQKRMLEFFMQTSIPRKKARIINHLSEKKKEDDLY